MRLESKNVSKENLDLVRFICHNIFFTNETIFTYAYFMDMETTSLLENLMEYEITQPI